MTVVGICMCKDELDILPSIVTHMAGQVDAVLVMDNMSSDGTWEWLIDEAQDIPNVAVIRDAEPAYYQSRKMTALAREAHSMFGADWIVPFDADEYWYSPFSDRIAELLERQADQWLAVSARLYDHVPTVLDVDNIDDPTKRIGWRRIEPTPLPKMVGRYREDMVIEQGNHSITYRGGTTVIEHQLVVRHFPWRSEMQFLSKVINGFAAYEATDLPETLGAHWRGYGAILRDSGPQAAIDGIFKKYFWSASPLVSEDLIYDPAP